MNFSLRKRRAAAAAKGAGVDGMLVTHLPDVRYLCGFTGSNAALVLAGGRAVLFTDGRYTGQAKAEAVGTRVVIASKPAVVAACEWVAATGVRRCGFDAANTTVAGLETMRKAVPVKMRRGMFVAVGPLVARMREVKDAEEIARMRKAARVGCELFDGMLTYLQAGLTGGGDELRYDRGQRGAIGAAAWPGYGREVAEAGVRDAGFRCYSRRILQRYDAYRAHGQGDAG